MTAGGDITTNEKTPGLLGGANVLFNNPWTFLPSGTTGDRPVPTVAIYYRLRLNTTLQVYEYFNPITATWTELSGSGTGTINPGLTNAIPFYPAAGTTLSPLSPAANAVLVTSAGMVPSLSTTLPTALTIPGATITGSTAALLSGSVVAAPVAGTDLANKTYVDSFIGSGVSQIIGTTNQVLANGTTGSPQVGPVTLTLPQDIALGSTPTFGGLTLTSVPLGSSSGGTGINNGSSTLTLGGSLTTSGAFASTFTMTGATNVTFPTSGTLATTAGTVSSVSGTANRITSTGGTTPIIDISAAYVGQTSITTLGTITTGTWNGTTIAIANGGTGVTSVTTSPTATAFAGWDTNSNLSAHNFIEGFTTTATAGASTTLLVGSNNIQEFTGTLTQTLVLPVTSTLVAGQSYYVINNSSGVVTVTSSGGGTIQALAANTSLFVTCVLNSGTTAASWNGSYIVDAGGGVSPGTANQLAYYAVTGNNVSGLASANDGLLVTSNTGVPSILAGPGTTGNILQSNAAAAPSFSTATYPSTSGTTGTILRSNGTNWVNSTSTFADTYSASTLLYSNGANTVTGLATANSASLVTTSAGVPVWSGTMTNGQLIIGSTGATPVAASLTAGTGITITPGAGTLTIASTGGVTIAVQSFTGNGTYTPTSGMAYCIVEMVGGGGGSAGVASGGGTNYRGSCGGSAGGYARVLLTAAQIGASKAVTIGAAGAAGASGANNGGDGGTTSLGSTLISCTGGKGSLTTTASAPQLGGVPTVTTGTTIGTANGTVGTLAVSDGSAVVIVWGGNGASSQFGAGGIGAYAGTPAAGTAGLGFGSGGGGSANLSAAQAGAAGTAGYMVITEYI